MTPAPSVCGQLDGGPRRSKALAAPAARDLIEQAVAAVFAVPLAELKAQTRRKAPIAFARQVAMYLAHVVCGLSLTEVGLLFGRDRTTVGHACGLIEDRRDDPVFDHLMEHLERAIMRLMAAVTHLGAERR